MAHTNPQPLLKGRLSALLLAFCIPVVQCISENATEIDIISPAANGRYRVNADRGLAVVIAVQNKAAGADPAQWSFDWEVKTKSSASSNFFSDSGSIGTPQFAVHPVFDIQTGEAVSGYRGCCAGGEDLEYHVVVPCDADAESQEYGSGNAAISLGWLGCVGHGIDVGRVM
ncbi:hypothetical protein B0T16DRAFT_140130 [Cercophora newfieldiana]|uniref:Uncharacterized protein n=1 Tax=Cercophora newfieldiana TaxID=92897 RepID=A0AA39Y4A7_9PEZI|nr:hypothetical protein B0T16DRAFT_140130 [Cercophora newfieldiana]